MKSRTSVWLLLASAAGLASFGCSAAPMDTTEEAATNTQALGLPAHTIGAIPDVLAGDADLYTQNGRRTWYDLYVQKQRLEVDSNGYWGVFYVEVNLIEQYIPDGTHLHYAGEERVQIPWPLNDFTCNPVYTSGFIYDKSWDFKSVYSVASTSRNCILKASIKADGEGIDNTNNAKVQLVFNPN